jgi:hypothetical protein
LRVSDLGSIIEHMFEQLASAVAEVDPVDDGASLAELVSLDDRLHAKVLRSLATFDASAAWVLDGDGSLTAWLKHHTDRSPGAAGALARAAKLLARLPETAAAYEDGRLSRGQLDAIIANVTMQTVDHFAEAESELLPCLFALPAVDAARVMQEWRVRIESLLDEKEAPDHARSFTLASTFGRRWHGALTLDDEGGTTVDTALALAVTHDAEGEPLRSFAHKRADALVDIARFFLDHRAAPSKGRHRPHVNVMISLDDLQQGESGSTIDGRPMAASDVETLLCDCDVHRVLTDARGVILDYGRATKTVPTPLFNALALRDRGCRHPGCNAPVAWCDAHHVVHWSKDGPTNMGNLVLKCRRHHRLGHRRRWREELLPDGTLVITTETGLTMTSRPPGTLLAAA